MYWDGNLSRDLALCRTALHRAERGIGARCSATKDGTSPFSAARDIRPFLEPQFFFDRYAVYYMAPAWPGWMR
jgi:hypothetical protein